MTSKQAQPADYIQTAQNVEVCLAKWIVRSYQLLLTIQNEDFLQNASKLHEEISSGR
jgi:hypothetical protein